MSVQASRSKQAGIFYVDVYPYVVRDGEPLYLMLLRRDDVPLPRTWQLVSGKVLPDERISAAFFRQVESKTGQRPARVAKMSFVNTFYDDHYDTVMMVPGAICPLASEEVRIDATLHLEHRFAGYDEAASLLVWPGQREGLRLAQEVASGRRVPHALEWIEAP